MGKKRDGKIVEFDIHKIENAIAKAFEAVNKSYSKDIIELKQDDKIILELMKVGKITISQEEIFDDIYIESQVAK